MVTASVLSIDNGFSTKSQAPLFTAFTATSIEAWPEIITTGTSG